MLVNLGVEAVYVETRWKEHPSGEGDLLARTTLIPAQSGQAVEFIEDEQTLVVKGA